MIMGYEVHFFYYFPGKTGPSWPIPMSSSSLQYPFVYLLPPPPNAVSSPGVCLILCPRFLSYPIDTTDKDCSSGSAYLLTAL